MIFVGFAIGAAFVSWLWWLHAFIERLRLPSILIEPESAEKKCPP